MTTCEFDFVRRGEEPVCDILFNPPKNPAQDMCVCDDCQSTYAAT